MAFEPGTVTWLQKTARVSLYRIMHCQEKRQTVVYMSIGNSQILSNVQFSTDLYMSRYSIRSFIFNVQHISYTAGTVVTCTTALDLKFCTDLEPPATTEILLLFKGQLVSLTDTDTKMSCREITGSQTHGFK